MKTLTLTLWMCPKKVCYLWLNNLGITNNTSIVSLKISLTIGMWIFRHTPGLFMLFVSDAAPWGDCWWRSFLSTFRIPGTPDLGAVCEDNVPACPATGTESQPRDGAFRLVCLCHCKHTEATSVGHASPCISKINSVVSQKYAYTCEEFI